MCTRSEAVFVTVSPAEACEGHGHLPIAPDCHRAYINSIVLFRIDKDVD